MKKKIYKIAEKTNHQQYTYIMQENAYLIYGKGIEKTQYSIIRPPTHNLGRKSMHGYTTRGYCNGFFFTFILLYFILLY